MIRTTMTFQYNLNKIFLLKNLSRCRGEKGEKNFFPAIFFPRFFSPKKTAPLRHLRLSGEKGEKNFLLKIY